MHGSVRHPQAQGCVERVNQTLKRSLNITSEALVTEWDKVLDQVVECYNTKPHRSTQETPAVVMALKLEANRAPANREEELAKINAIIRLNEIHDNITVSQNTNVIYLSLNLCCYHVLKEWE